MEKIEEKTISEIVAEDFRAAQVFENHKIDFCCKGNRTVAEACEEKNLDPKKILKEIDEVKQGAPSTTTDFKNWPLDLLADYIEKKHHRYVEEKTPILKQYLEKLCEVHGSNHPELFEITESFLASAGELAAHMKKEEFILFPHVRKMINRKENNHALEIPHFGTVKNPVQMMMDEHTVEGERFMEIAKLSDNYTPPADACNTYKVTYAMLKEFEDDLHLHIHLENNILFPKSIELEKELSDQII